MNRSDHPHFNPWLALVVVCFGQFMVVLDATIVNVALPAIQTDLGFSDTSLAWVVNAYTLFFGGFLLLGGRAADLLGRRSLFIAGVALFSLASLANGLATSETQLIVGRAIQGLGGAMLSPAALSVITTSFAEGARTHQSALDLGGRRRGRRRGRPAARRLPGRKPLLGMDLLRQRAGRHRRSSSPPCDWVPNSRPGERPAPLRPRRRGHRHRRPGRPRLRDRRGLELGLGLGQDARRRRPRHRPARRLRRDRAPLARPAGAAGPLPAALAGDRQRRLPDGRRRPLRDVLLRLALPAEHPRLLAADHRPRLPPGHLRDRDRRHGRRETDPPASACARCS